MSRSVTAIVAGLATVWVSAPWVSMARRGTLDQQHARSLADPSGSEGFWSTAVPLPRSAPPRLRTAVTTRTARSA